jgi:hypothetical protein
MSKLCEAFNRINSKFGANRVKVLYLDRWLTAIANGKVRDEAGNMIDPENQVSNKSKVWPEAC